MTALVPIDLHSHFAVAGNRPLEFCLQSRVLYPLDHGALANPADLIEIGLLGISSRLQCPEFAQPGPKQFNSGGPGPIH